MLSKSKLKRLKGELEKLGYSQEQVAKNIGSTKPTLYKIYSGKKYDGALVKALIELRNVRLTELKQLEAAI